MNDPWKIVTGFLEQTDNLKRRDHLLIFETSDEYKCRKWLASNYLPGVEPTDNFQSHFFEGFTCVKIEGVVFLKIKDELAGWCDESDVTYSIVFQVAPSAIFYGQEGTGKCQCLIDVASGRIDGINSNRTVVSGLACLDESDRTHIEGLVNGEFDSIRVTACLQENKLTINATWPAP